MSVGGSSHLQLKRILAEANLDPERDVTVTFIGNEAALVVALGQKQIDGFLMAPPSVIQSVARGDAIVLVSGPAGDMYWQGKMAADGMIALEQTISGKPDVVDSAVRALWRSQRTFNEEPARTAKALRALDFYAEIDEPAFNMSIDALQGLVPKDPLLTQQQFDDLVKGHNTGLNPEDQTKITKGQLFDYGPAQRAKKQLGF
ncbi:MAG: ABC transporter substrate-binding protein [Chloroflexi bacterium]|nr:ABC transporter substrate-binding protein [Chloroflexota bacterium]